MGWVWELDLSEHRKFVLLALADHADHEGRGVRPSHRLIAWKTGYSERSVRRIIGELLDLGILTIVRPAAGGRDGGRPAEYRIDMSKGPRRPPFRYAGESALEETAAILSAIPEERERPIPAETAAKSSRDSGHSCGRLTVKEPSGSERPPVSPQRGESRKRRRSSILNPADYQDGKHLEQRGR